MARYDNPKARTALLLAVVGLLPGAAALLVLSPRDLAAAVVAAVLVGAEQAAVATALHRRGRR